MAISVVQRGTAQDSASSGTVSKAFGVSVTAGNSIIAIVGVNNNVSNIGIPTDTLGNTYLKATNIYQQSMNTGFVAYVAYSSPGGANTVSCSDNFNQGALFIYEVSGLAGNHAFDAYATQQITGVSTVSPSITTQWPNALLLGFFGTEDTSAFTYTVGTGYSNIQTNAFINWSTACEEQIVSSTGSYTAGVGGPSGQVSQCAIIAFSDTPIKRSVVIPNNALRPHVFSPGLAR